MALGRNLSICFTEIERSDIKAEFAGVDDIAFATGGIVPCECRSIESVEVGDRAGKH